MHGMRAIGDAAQAYAVGLDAQRHSAALHANAALASLRMRCYVQSIAHCDKARSGLRAPPQRAAGPHGGRPLRPALQRRHA